MESSRKLHISVGDSRFSRDVKKKTVTWRTLSTRLLDVRRTDETYEEYVALSPAKQTEIKDQGFFVGGQFAGRHKKISDLISRCVVALDIDHLKDPQKVRDTYGDFEYVLHSTHKHSDQAPRLRLVFPLTKDVTPEQYEPLARQVAADMGLDDFDDTTFQPARVMFWGTASSDADVIAERNEGEWLDPDVYLGRYQDWKDTTAWPTSKREGTIKHRAKEASDPLSAPGVIGAFNRVFDIHAAIEHYELPYEQVAGSRYRFLGSTGGPGAIVYDDIFLYTHHESDPAYSHIRNAFDLVRVHLFGENDDESVPVMKRASMQSMIDLAMKERAVSEELAHDEFEALEDESEDEPKQDLSLDGILNTINGMLQPSIDDMNHVMRSVAVSRKLSTTDVDVIIKAIQTRWPGDSPGLRAIKKTIDEFRNKAKPEQRGRDDIERLLIERVLKRYYASGRHLIRWAEQWWSYQNGVWRKEGDETVRGRLGDAVIELKEKYPEDAKILADALGDGKTSAITGQLWKMFCSYMAVRETSQDPLRMHQLYMDPVINCLNGEIHFDDSGLYEFAKHDYRHRLTHQLSVEYNPDAECPHWDQFMALILQDMQDPEAVKSYLYEICGYLIQPDRYLKTWVLFHGEGYNGKSAIGSVLGQMLGESSAERSLASYGGDNTHAEAGLVGKLMLLDDDYTEGNVLPDGLIKKLSEAKRITANPKFAPEFNFVARAVPVILSNHWPVSRDTSLAIRERAQIIDLNYYVKPHERNERAQRIVLENELPGVLNHFIEGYARLKLRGRFDAPPECRVARDKWVSMSNPISMWAEECLIIGEGFTTRETLWSCYEGQSQQPSRRPLQEGDILG